MRAVGSCFAIFVLVVVLGDTVPAAADDPSPAPQPTPSSKGCDRLDAYLEQRLLASQQLGQMVLITAPGFIETASFENLSTADFLALSEALFSYAKTLDRIQPPPVAVPYHDAFMLMQEHIGFLFRDMGIVGIDKAFDRHQSDLDAAELQLETASAAALGVCPAFQAVIDFDAPKV